MTSHFAGYLDSVKDQEIPIKYIQHKRKCDQEKIPTMMNKCRLCYTNVEDATHVISSCGKTSARYHLLLRHNALAKYIQRGHFQEESSKLKLY